MGGNATGVQQNIVGGGGNGPQIQELRFEFQDVFGENASN